MPLLSPGYEVITADLPSFGDSGILSVPATTENVGRIFHEAGLAAFVASCGRQALMVDLSAEASGP